jgi:dTMP kinase
LTQKAVQKNKFIVIDGMDGSGKGEMVERLKAYLQGKGFAVLATFEPTDGDYGKILRKILQEEQDPNKNAEKMLNLYVKDREEHLASTIQPFLRKDHEKGNIVISDRYYYATIAYQSVQGLPLPDVIEKNLHFPKPNLALILDLPPEDALKRIAKARPSIEKFEKLQFMKKLRGRFLELKELLADNIVVIDASKPAGSRHYCLDFLFRPGSSNLNECCPEVKLFETLS